MRVIAGTAKGARLGPVPAGVRPVSDRAREGLFSSLGDLVDGALVLDLFAGTGAMGIEALSRGGALPLMVDRAPRAVAAIGGNLTRTRLGDRAQVVRSDVARFLAVPPPGASAFDLVFLDPPYASGASEIDSVFGLLGRSGVLAKGATVVLTRDSRDPIDVIPVGWLVAKRLTYGDSVLTLVRTGNPPGSTEV